MKPQTDPAPKQWVVYCRVSTDDQAREGVSLDAQRVACENAASFHGITIREVIADPGYSGKDFDRPGVSRILSELDAGLLAGVIVYKLDRLSRSRRDVEDLMIKSRDRGWGIISVCEKIDTSSAMGRFFVALLANIAQWFREDTSERVSMGIRHRKAQGGFYGGRPPVGFKVVGTPGKREMEKDEATAPVLAQAWDMIIGGATLKQVGQHLKGNGIRGGWSASSVRSMLLNDRYVGCLVDADRFRVAKSVLSKRFNPKNTAGRMHATATHSTRVWPLQGVARCGHCDALLIGVHARNTSGVSYPYLRCSKRNHHGKEACPAKDLPAETYEHAAAICLQKTIEQEPALLPSLAKLQSQRAQEAGPLKEQQDGLRMKRDAVAAKIRRLIDLASDGDALSRAYAPVIAESQLEAERLDGDIVALDSRIGATEGDQQSAEVLIECMRSMIDGMDTAPIEHQALTLQCLISSIKLNPAQEEFTLNLRIPASAEFVPQCEKLEFTALRTNALQLTFTVRANIMTARQWRDRMLALAAG